MSQWVEHGFIRFSLHHVWCRKVDDKDHHQYPDCRMNLFDSSGSTHSNSIDDKSAGNTVRDGIHQDHH